MQQYSHATEWSRNGSERNKLNTDMHKVYTIAEATYFFLHHKNVSVICVKRGKEKVVSTYAEAVTFYNPTRKKPQTELSI